MRFNPEDESLTGPRCRNCHKGSSSCGACHNTAPGGNNVGPDNALDEVWNAGQDEQQIVSRNVAAYDYEGDGDYTAMGEQVMSSDIMNLFMILMMGPSSGGPYPMYDGWASAYTGYKLGTTSTGAANQIAQAQVITHGSDTSIGGVKNSRTVGWSTGWRADETTSSPTCSDDGLSWPHRTLGYMMLKDDLFGIDVGVAADTDKSDSEMVAAGATRAGQYGNGQVAHDIDSVCLDCHNPTVYNATSALDHVDDPMDPNDDADDDLIYRGLP